MKMMKLLGDIARSFNKKYKKVFRVPQVLPVGTPKAMIDCLVKSVEKRPFQSKFAANLAIFQNNERRKSASFVWSDDLCGIVMRNSLLKSDESAH